MLCGTSGTQATSRRLWPGVACSALSQTFAPHTNRVQVRKRVLVLHVRESTGACRLAPEHLAEAGLAEGVAAAENARHNPLAAPPRWSDRPAAGGLADQQTATSSRLQDL